MTVTNLAWIYKELTLPAFSAIEIYERCAGEPNSVFLDSGMVAHGMARYSFIARDPFLLFSSKDRQVRIQMGEELRTIEDTDPFEELRVLLNRYQMPRHPELPPLLAGAIGYFGYDLGYLVEKLPELCVDDLAIPDCCIGFYDTVMIFDHQEQKTYVSSTGFPEQDESLRQARAQLRIAEWEALLKQPFSPLPVTPPPHGQGRIQANFTREEYCNVVQRSKDYIAAGDIFQVNISQRLHGTLYESPFALYKRLRSINPAPFASYLNFADAVIASASPERYLLVQGKDIETRPIKGTRPRGADPIADERLRQELWTSEKDRAELVMIIDLERNDLGRVCKYGSVRVPDLIRLEEYATVFHLVSTVVGELAEERDIIDLIKASFPGGSITGAPKVRAMEIIDELEPVRRAVYTGSIGYIDFSGDADLNIVIRTFVIKENIAYCQVGGAIVADSDPMEEYAETLHKARALLRALGHKEGTL